MTPLQLLAFYSIGLAALVLLMGWLSGLGAMALFTALLGIVAGGLSCAAQGINGVAGRFRSLTMAARGKCSALRVKLLNTLAPRSRS